MKFKYKFYLAYIIIAIQYVKSEALETDSNSK